MAIALVRAALGMKREPIPNERAYNLAR